MLDLREGVLQIFREAEQHDLRVLAAEHLVRRRMLESARARSGKQRRPATPKKMCRFCRQAYKKPAHFLSCEGALADACERARARRRACRRIGYARDKLLRAPEERLAPLSAPHDCRFCRRPYHHELHFKGCLATPEEYRKAERRPRPPTKMCRFCREGYTTTRHFLLCEKALEAARRPTGPLPAPSHEALRYLEDLRALSEQKFFAKWHVQRSA